MFKYIIKEQEKHKEIYISGLHPPEAGISIQIKNNTIADIQDGENLMQNVRKAQYVQLIKNTLGANIVKDCYININLRDKPVKGCFNFCRKLDSVGFFLLPNQRFTKDDVQIINSKKETPTHTEQVSLIRSRNTPYETKINKFYTAGSPFGFRRPYFEYASIHSFCEGAAYLPQGGSRISPSFLQSMRQHDMITRKYVPFIRHTDYKYIVYLDGNTLSDRMRLLLCINSVIVRKKANGKSFIHTNFKIK